MQVRSAREARGWSQEHLAAAAGVSLRTVQRAEAGSRVSAENTLALCATLEIEPAHLPSVPSTGPGTLPHLERLRTGLDKALAEFGERPLWQKADASPFLADALGRMGLPPDGKGFAEATRRVRRHQGRLDTSQDVFTPLAFAWVIGLLMLPSCIMALHRDFAGVLGVVGPLVLAWIVGTISLAMLLRWQARAYSRLRPTTGPEIEVAGIVSSDLRPVEAALTRDYLWTSEDAFGEVRVTRTSLKAIGEVSVARAVDGFHSATFRVEGVLTNEGVTVSHRLTRLRDDEARWLERRFGTLSKSVVWSPAMA